MILMKLKPEEAEWSLFRKISVVPEVLGALWLNKKLHIEKK